MTSADCKAEAYVTYGENNKLVLVANIKSKEALNNTEEVKEVVAKHCMKAKQPYACNFCHD